MQSVESKLRDYQAAAVDHVVDFFATATRGSRAVLAAPTGSGKSFVEAAVQERLGPHCWIVTPRLDIAAGILAKKGATWDRPQDLVEASFAHRVVTPVRFRNALARGEVPDVKQLIFDEGHHATASTYEQLQLLCGMPPAALFTATPFRGTSRGTAAFLEAWGEPTWIITLREAAARGDIAVPSFSVLPLVDDDVIELASNGDFEVTQVTSSYRSRLKDLADAALEWFRDSLWDRTTVFALPSVELAQEFAAELCSRNAPCFAVSAEVSRADREVAFQLLTTRHAAIAQVAVLGEGVDLPVRRLVDAAPRMSPVAWMQQLGRATRPTSLGEAPPSYVCTNRNLQRFAYLMDGLLPPRVVAAADLAFGSPSKRTGYRAMGLEAIGRFKATQVGLADGCSSVWYNLVSITDGRSREYACLVHPSIANPIWAERVHGANADGTRDWGKWKRCEAPKEVIGFASIPPKAPSEKQLAWWQRSAAGRGLDSTVIPDRRVFAVLPFLFDLGISFGGKQR